MLKGWQKEITDITSYDGLPREIKDYIGVIEDFIGVPVKLISVGPKRSQTIVREPLI
jgi:adenylosuccinate synthase